MTATQPELTFEQPVDPAQEVVWLEELLVTRKIWMTAREIAAATAGRVSDREIREAASITANVISGQRGYKHVANATAEEINHAANWLESQAKKMSQRACAIRRRANQVVG